MNIHLSGSSPTSAFLSLSLSTDDQRFVLAAAGLVALGGMVLGFARSRRLHNRIDPFHPLLFPLLYVSVSFIAPAWAMLVAGEPLGGFTASDLAPETAALMFLAVAGFTAGAGLHFRQRLAAYINIPDPSAQKLAGRILMLVPLGLAARNALVTGLAKRGVNQVDITALDILSVISLIGAPTATLLLLNGHRAKQGTSLLPPGDWLLILGVLVFTGMAGDRGGAIAIMICLMWGYSKRGGSTKRVLIGFATILLFAVLVVTYRSNVLIASYDDSPTDAILWDWSVATYTTGVTASVVPDSYPSANGWTYLDAVVRQVPSPITNRLLGPPDATGNQAFREMINYTNPNNGLGYSLPAEGYLNFGAVGVFGSCFLYGAFVSFAYSRARWPANRPISLLYPIVLAAMPLGIRSDALGLVKGTLYPVLIIVITMGVARSFSKSRTAEAESSAGTVANAR